MVGGVEAHEASALSHNPHAMTVLIGRRCRCTGGSVAQNVRIAPGDEWSLLRFGQDQHSMAHCVGDTRRAQIAHAACGDTASHFVFKLLAAAIIAVLVAHFVVGQWPVACPWEVLGTSFKAATSAEPAVQRSITHNMLPEKQHKI
jgi:hypothetical protein